MYGYIYLTTNLINGKKYIGQHQGTFDTRYLGSGRLLWEDIKRLGRDNFKCEPIEYCETKELLDKREVEFIEKYDAVENHRFYNVAEGGHGGRTLQEYPTGKEHHWYGRKQSEYQKQQVSKALKGKKRPLEVIAKLPQNQKGNRLSEEHKLKLGKKQKVLDIQTNEVFEFSSVKELCEELNIKRAKYDNDKRYKRELIAGRYKLLEEEIKYERN